MRCCAQVYDACSYSCFHQRTFHSDYKNWVAEWELGIWTDQIGPYCFEAPYSSDCLVAASSGNNFHSHVIVGTSDTMSTCYVPAQVAPELKDLHPQIQTVGPPGAEEWGCAGSVRLAHPEVRTGIS